MADPLNITRTHRPTHSFLPDTFPVCCSENKHIPCNLESGFYFSRNSWIEQALCSYQQRVTWQVGQPCLIHRQGPVSALRTYLCRCLPVVAFWPPRPCSTLENYRPTSGLQEMRRATLASITHKRSAQGLGRKFLRTELLDTIGTRGGTEEETEPTRFQILLAFS